MGRIVTPLGAGQSFFGRTSRVKLGTGPITTINPIKAIGQGALATAAGVKAIEGVADLTIKGFGAIAKGVAEGKRAAARKALEQDRAKQQAQPEIVDRAVQEAGKALEGMDVTLKPPREMGAEDKYGQFFRDAGIGYSQVPDFQMPGLLTPQELRTPDQVRERLIALGARPGPGQVIADSTRRSPEEQALLGELSAAEARAQQAQAARNPLLAAGISKEDVARFQERALLTPLEKEREQTTLANIAALYGVDNLGEAGDRDPDLLRRVREDAMALPSESEEKARDVREYAEYLRTLRTNPQRLMIGADPVLPTDEDAANLARLDIMNERLDDARRRDGSVMPDRSVTPLSPVMGLGQTGMRFAPVDPSLTDAITPLGASAREVSRLEDFGDLGAMSDRALETYSPAQLVAAAGFAKNQGELQRILDAAKGQATPTNFAQLVSGKPQQDLEVSIVENFGKNVKKPLSLKEQLQIRALERSLGDTSAQDLRDARRREIEARITRDEEKANRIKNTPSYKKSRPEVQAVTNDFLEYVQNYGMEGRDVPDSFKDSQGEPLRPSAAEGRFKRNLKKLKLSDRAINQQWKNAGGRGAVSGLRRSFVPTAGQTLTSERATDKKKKTEQTLEVRKKNLRKKIKREKRAVSTIQKNLSSAMIKNNEDAVKQRQKDLVKAVKALEQTKIQLSKLGEDPDQEAPQAPQAQGTSAPKRVFRVDVSDPEE